ncbi:MAG: FMN-binding protein [Acidaminococcales bacterium]|nr:FMN-binding protein [Acidaminococcales bacterium]
MKGYRIFWGAIFIAAALLSFACAPQAAGMQDGYYMAEAAAFDLHGWKEFVAIYVSNNKIITVEYNAKNASGFIKSWDTEYMRVMNQSDGNYPNKYTRHYSARLLEMQDPGNIYAVSGATHSHASFQLLAKAAIAQAQAGDKQVAFVDLSGAATQKSKG